MIIIIIRLRRIMIIFWLCFMYPNCISVVIMLKLTIFVLVGFVAALSAFRYPEEKLLDRLYDLEAMRQRRVFEDDPRYRLVPQGGEEEHPLTIDDILPYLPEDEDEFGQQQQQEDEEPEDDPEYYRENNLQIRDDSDAYLSADPETRSNDLRDPEQAQQSALWGTHYVSGGSSLFQ